MTVTLKPGFADPPTDAARCFRLLLNAMSRPGLVQAVPDELPPAGRMNPASVMVALTLCDHESPVWLDSPTDDEAISYIRFHCNAPIVEDPASASFAFFHQCPDTGLLDRFDAGSADYPDTSATLVIQVDGLSDRAPGVLLSGPGIETFHTLSAAGLPDEFWSWFRSANSGFPLGMDVILAAPGQVAALPRTVRIQEAT